MNKIPYKGIVVVAIGCALVGQLQAMALCRRLTPGHAVTFQPPVVASCSVPRALAGVVPQACTAGGRSIP